MSLEKKLRQWKQLEANPDYKEGFIEATNETLKELRGVTDKIREELKKLRTEMRDEMTNGWLNHERAHWNDWLKEEIEPHFPTLYKFLTTDKITLALLVDVEKNKREVERGR